MSMVFHFNVRETKTILMAILVATFTEYITINIVFEPIKVLVFYKIIKFFKS